MLFGIDLSNSLTYGFIAITNVGGSGMVISNVVNAFGVREEGVKITNPGGNGITAIDMDVLEEIVHFGLDYMKANYETWDQ